MTGAPKADSSERSRPPIDLLWLSERPVAPPVWPHGETLAARPRAADLAATARALPTGDTRWLLLWSARLGPPPAAGSRGAWSEHTQRPVDVVHAGLRLGLAGLPRWDHAVRPAWMLTADPLDDREATSWRVGLEACLVRSALWRATGGPDAGYRTLAAAGLALGRRWLAMGAVLRHDPGLLPADRVDEDLVELPPVDEARFLRHTAGRRWAAFGVACAIVDRQATSATAWRAWSGSRDAPRASNEPFRRPRGARASAPPQSPSAKDDPSVTVLVPTIDRYPYLEVLLDQLRRQTVPPVEILVIDQTAADRRDRGMQGRFADLPLRWTTLAAAGQCSSRNRGLQAARGEAILFLDDDDEIEPDLIARHLNHLRRTGADASCGVAVEPGGGPLPPEFRRARIADVLPTNNAMVRRAALERSGLFDLAFERGPRADHDLGTRLWRSGALLLLDPSISVLHHHAPRGGLRTHHARVHTYAASRSRLTVRHLAAPTEIYLALRHHGRRRARQALRLRTLGTLAGRGSAPRRLLKALVGLVQLPHTLATHRRRWREAMAALDRFPQIPQLAGRRPGDDRGDRSPAEDAR
ncbi:MAG: glycosyltransferase family A protein [Acidobacteriota bacterium]